MMRVLYVLNKKPPEGDYRLVYPALSGKCAITYACPDKPDGVADGAYVRLAIREGMRLTYLREMYGFLRYLRAHRDEYDIVHFYSTLLTLIGPMLCLVAGLRSMVTITGFGRVFSSCSVEARVLKPVYMALLGISVRLATTVLLQNRPDLEWLKQRFHRLSGKFQYVGSTVSAPVTDPGMKDYGGPLVVVCVSRLIPDKGIGDFLAVAGALSGTQTEFVLVGPASASFPVLLNTVQACHASGTVIYRGELPYRETQLELARAHVLYFPSYYGEGLSRVMVEGGLAGLCPIACDIPQNTDLVDHDTGFLVRVGDTNAVVTILSRLSKDRALLRTLAAAYQEHVLSEYGRLSFCRRMDDIMVRATSGLPTTARGRQA